MEPKDRGSESCLTPTTLERTLGGDISELETRSSPDTIIHWHLFTLASRRVRSKCLNFKLHDLWCSGTKTDHKPAMVCGFDLGCRRRSSTGQYLTVNESSACETQV